MRKTCCLLLVLAMALSVFGFAGAEGLVSGEYKASAAGRNGEVAVNVVIDEGKIALVEITSHTETAGIADPAINKLPGMIVDAQSANIDSVSGATLTSEAILTAVKDCLEQAGVDPGAMTAEVKTYEKNLKAGVYQATAHGHHADVTVEVALSETAIGKIDVTANGDTLHISDAAVAQIPEAVVASQSVAVDTVTGATFTSRAILTAIEDCLTQAGGSDAVKAFSVPVEKTERSTEEKEETYDVVVVGSGLAGMCAATAAQEAGANVAIVEKLSYYGGISQTSAGAARCASENENGAEDYYNYLLKKHVGLMQDDAAKNNGYPDEEACKVMVDEARPTLQWLETKGVGIMYRESSDELGMYSLGVGSFYDGEHFAPNSCGAAIEVLMNRFLDAGGKLYLETPAVSLIINEAGDITGVKAEGKDGNYTFNAKGVCLCCGGFGANAEMIAELAPAFAGETVGATGIGNTGDGIRMAREIGAAVYDDQFLMGGSGHYFWTDSDMKQPYADAESPKSSIYVNPMGQRVNSETPVSYTPAITYCNPDVDDYYWVITNGEVAESNYYDSYYVESEETVRGKYIDLLNEALDEGRADIFKADTVAELAKMINIVPTTLMYTISHYNNMCEAGEDTDLYKAAQYLIPMYDGPWYATKANMEFFGTVGGVVTNAASAVLREDGSVIKGLYAAGETSNHKILNMSYSGGVSVCENIVFGKISGDNAAKDAGF